MTWRSITDEEYEICRKMVIWLDTRKKWQSDEAWLPTDADISKSALFERLMNGLDPLPWPPPRGLSCPWYAVVEDRGPHYAGNVKESLESGFGPYFGRFNKQGEYSKLSNSEADVNDEATIWQSGYVITKKISDLEFIIKDDYYETPYRFRLWWDKNYKYTSTVKKPPQGGWMIRNVEFDD